MTEFIKSAIYILLILLSLEISAQDIQRSQYFAIPLELNPAYTGTSKDFSAFLNYRVQYPSFENPYVSHHFSGDYHFKNRKSGLGILFNNDRVGPANFTTSSFHIQYASGVDISQTYSLRMGLRAGMMFRRIGFDDLIFGDQLDAGGNVSGPSAEPVDDLGNITFPTVGAGLLFYHKKYWLGLVGDHLNNPDQSIITNQSKLNTRLVIHAGYKFPFLNARGRVIKDLREVSLAPMMQLKLQGPSHQFDLGTHLIAEPLLFGIWYRGIPVPSFERDGVLNQDALVFLIGAKLDEFRFSYSYDLGIGPLANTNSGSHELTLSLKFGFYKWGVIKTYPKTLPMPIL